MIGEGGISPGEVIQNVQAEVLSPAKNMFRTADVLRQSAQRLEQVWSDQVPRLSRDQGRQRAREAAAMTAHARWMYAAALSRQESRGMHQRDDCSGTDPAQTRRLRVCGLEAVRVAPEAAS